MQLQSKTEGESAKFGLAPGPNFLLITGAAAAIGSACVSRSLARRLLLDALEQIRLRAGVDPELAIVLSTGPLPCGDLFYLPLANDARGIGYQHEDPREVFDDTPESRLQGIAFLNDFPYWTEHVDEFRDAFNHEVGHRWGARVRALVDGSPTDLILGRERHHWSYFLDTRGSPLEGNIWEAVSRGRFRAYTPVGARKFSDLDLYVMGVLPAADVGSQQLLRASQTDAIDCSGRALSAASVPQWCSPLELEAEASTVSAQAVIEAEGERVPAPSTVPKTVDAAVIIAMSGKTPFDSETCSAVSSAIDERFADFAEATRNKLTLHNSTVSNASCAEWQTVAGIEPPTESAQLDESGCSVSAARPHSERRNAWVLAVLLGAWVARRERANERSPLGK